MKKFLIYSTNFILISLLVSYFSCKKRDNFYGKGERNTINFFSQTESDDSLIVNELVNNEILLKENLEIYALATVLLIKDTQIVNIVSAYMNNLGYYRISFSSLSSLCNSNNINLYEKMLESLDSARATERQKERFIDIYTLFTLEGTGIEFRPEIVFPALDTGKAFDASYSSWDVKTPCMVATSLFNMETNAIPYFTFDANGNFSSSTMSNSEIFKKPVWHISLIANFDYSLGRDGVIMVDEHGYPTGIRAVLASLMNQIQLCGCVEYAEGTPEGPRHVSCEGSGQTACGPTSGGCAGKCVLAMIEKIVIEECY